MTRDRGPAARAERVRSAYYAGNQEEEEDLGWERPASGGLTRILVVVILLHVAGIAGVLGYRWLHRDGPEAGREGTGAAQAKVPPVEELVPEPRTNGKAIVVEHPALKGHIRYRVAKDEQLIDVARRFNASVAEVEKLNSLRLDTPLYVGQWLTVPDHRERLSDGSVAEPEPAPDALTEPKPVPGGAGSGREGDAGKEPSRPTPVVVQPEPVKVELPKPLPVPASGGILETYKVNTGDTAYRIALRYGITWQELLEFNGMKDPQKLQAGQVLKIPPKR